LCEWELKHFITRWLPADLQYKEMECSLLLDKREQLLLELWKTSQITENDSPKAVISFEDVLDITALECKLQSQGVWCQGTMPEKREIMDSHLMLCRSKEELCMLVEEIQNAINFYEDRKLVLLRAIDTMNSSCEEQPYRREITSLLHMQLQDASSLLQEAQNSCRCMHEGNDDELDFSDSDFDDSDGSDDETLCS